MELHILNSWVQLEQEDYLNVKFVFKKKKKPWEVESHSWNPSIQYAERMVPRFLRLALSIG